MSRIGKLARLVGMLEKLLAFLQGGIECSFGTTLLYLGLGLVPSSTVLLVVGQTAALLCLVLCAIWVWLHVLAKIKEG